MHWLWIAVIASLAACRILPPIPVPREEIKDDLRTAICDANRELNSYKGIGRISWRDNESIQHARMAWIGKFPDCLRIEILDMTGRPALTLATDGEHISAFSRIDNRFEAFGTGVADLSDFIPIDIPAKDVVHLLGGKTPVSGTDCAVSDMVVADAGRILEVRPGWYSRRYRFHFHAAEASFQRMEVFQPLGGLVYQAVMNTKQTDSGYLLPERIELSNPDGDFFYLDVDRCWVNVRTDASIFKLTPPNEPGGVK